LVLRTTAGQIDRRARQHQGSRLRRRATGAGRRARQQGSGAECRCGGGFGAQIGGRDRHLQDHHLRVRLQIDRRQPGVRHHPQPLESRSDQRRIERRCRSFDRRRMRPACDRHRWGRFDPCPVRVLWRGRYQADLRTGPKVARLFAAVVGVAGAHRTNRAHGCRRGTPSGNGCDPRFARCRQPAGAGAALRCDGDEARRDQDRQQYRLRVCRGGT
jgi:hypothetical protein